MERAHPPYARSDFSIHNGHGARCDEIAQTREKAQMNPDNYYGEKATNYEAKRANKTCWQREQNAVDDFVKRGPLLDVPCGTGRYFGTYQRKGIRDVTGMDISKDMLDIANKHANEFTRLLSGSIFTLDKVFTRHEFNTVVCSRMLNWFYAEDMHKAVSQLRHVARELVVSIRTGTPGRQPNNGNYTHRMRDWLEAIEGLYIADKRHILSAPDGDFYFYLLRAPVWLDVVDRFEWHRDGAAAIKRLSDAWADAMGIAHIRDFSLARVTCENYDAERIGKLIDDLAAIPRADGTANRMITNEQPMHDSGPLVVVRTQGREFMIDGRRRANLWRNRSGELFQCLVVSV